MRSLCVLLCVVAVAFASECEDIGGECVSFLKSCPSGTSNVGSILDSLGCGVLSKCCKGTGPTPEPMPDYTYTEGQCGQNGYSESAIEADESRIVGGHTASRYAWPWQVTIHRSSWLGTDHMCGGAIISQYWIATAAHCFSSNSASGNKVFIGAHSASGDDGTGMNIAKVVRHPSFNSQSNNNDIALLKLSSPITYSKKHHQACLPEKDDDFEGMDCVVTGWGNMKESGSPASGLQEVTVPVQSHDECYRTMSRYSTIGDAHLCAGVKTGGKDACQGDSGGPLVCRKGTERWKLGGIVSWGIGCARKNVYGVYTKVSHFRQWVEDTMAAN